MGIILLLTVTADVQFIMQPYVRLDTHYIGNLVPVFVRYMQKLQYQVSSLM